MGAAMSAETAGDEYTFKLDLNSLYLRFDTRITQVLERGLFALAGVDLVEQSPRHTPGVSLPHTGIEVQTRAIDHVRSETHAWILGGVCRDWLEETLMFLDQVRVMCAGASLAVRDKVSGTEWNQTVVEPGKDFGFMGFDKKVKCLKKTFGEVVDDRSEKISTIVRARNCLVHRLGFVTHDDLRSGETALVVKWDSMQLHAKNPGDNEMFAVTAERNRVEPGGHLFMKAIPTEHTFNPGERVNFTTQDLTGIHFTLKTFAHATSQKIADYARTKGFVFEVVPLPG